MGVGLVCAILSILLWSHGHLDWLEFATWDFRARTLANPAQSTRDICIIALDQYSLDFVKKNFTDMGSWPWVRELYTPIIDFCTRAGAKAIAFDVFFSEPSRLSVEDDRRLGASIASNGHFVLALPHGEATNWPPDMPASKLLLTGLKESTAAHQSNFLMPTATFSVPDIVSNAVMFGHAVGNPDADGKVRRTKPLLIFDNKPVASLGLAAFLAGNLDTKLKLYDNKLTAGQHDIPFTREGSTILNYRGPAQVYQILNAAAVINSELRLRENGQPEINPSVLRNKYVFFGYTAPGLFDQKITPVSRIYPGVAVHATVLDNLLSDDFIKESSPLSVIVLTILLTLATGMVARFCQTGTQTSLAFILILPIPMILGFLAYTKNIWLNIGVQEASITLTLISIAILNYAIEGKQKRFLKTAFKQYISGEVIDKLVKDPSHLKLGGETRELSIFFSDVAGFTGLSEILNPEQLTALLNEYLTAMTDIIYDEGGTIDKYEGDAIIAFWNAPLDLKDHQKHAVMAAIRCNKKLGELRPILKQKYGEDLFARIGINTGTVVVGNMGSIQRFNYTFLGDAGNLASRLEGLNKQFNTSIMISACTKKMLGNEFSCREISSVRVKGRKEPVKVFEPMFNEDYNAMADIIHRFEAGLRLYYSGQFNEAMEIFTTLSNTDGPSAAYVRICKELIENPPVNWDGVWEMKEK
ncbi:MAG: hypothetical protein A2283_08290 [Lentisphaerae bacterium RIFOXYA12_FULL_48_11]|nr:MAG: hypothetical protein A2283_08290 [Lentisphaerae bacterium RIFOXYA12_FULL_48_11]